MKNKTLSILMTLVILFAAIGAMSPQKVVAQGSNTPKVAVLEYWAMRGSPGMFETGRDLDIVAEEFSNQPVAIIE